MTSNNEPNTEAISHSTKQNDSRSEDHKLTTRTTHLHQQEINNRTDRCITIPRGDAPLSRRAGAWRRPEDRAAQRGGWGRAHSC